MDLNIHPPLPRRKDFRIGILGSGFIVDECHLVAYRKAGFNPVAIASRNRDHAAKVAAKHNILNVYDTYDALLADPTIEVLDIAVPPNALLPLIRKACEFKTANGILAQKPLGMNYAEAVEIVSLCETADITLAVNQNMRFDQSVRAAKTLLTNGTIGEPVIATIEMRGIPHWQPWQAELGWLTLRIMSIHHLDTFRYWFGSPQRIFCSTRPDPRTKFPHTDGICAYILEYDSGLRCIAIDDTWTGPAKEGCPADNYIKWRIEGLNGLAIGDIGWCREPYTTPSTIRYAAKGQANFESPVWPESWFPDAFVGTMADLLIALENNAEPTISGRDNLKTMDLVDAAYESARFHGVTAIDDRQSPSGRRVIVTSVKRVVDEGYVLRSTPNELPNQISNFTPRAQQVLALARKEANRMHHNFVGTEHVLLGVIALGQGTAFNVLIKMGLHLDTIKMEIEKQIGEGPGRTTIGHIPYTPRVKKVLALAARQAKGLKHNWVGTEHILLGLLEEGDGVAARILINLDIHIEEVSKEIVHEHDPHRLPAPPVVQSPVMLQFTPRAQTVLSFAREEAERYDHDFASTEHLLIGLLRLGQGVATQVLYRLGLSADGVRSEVEKQVGRGVRTDYSTNIPYTEYLKKTFSLAFKEAKTLNHNYVGSEHLLLGLLEETDGGAARILKTFNVDLAKTREEILNELDPNRNQQ